MHASLRSDNKGSSGGGLLKLHYPSPGITVWLSHETLRVKRTNMAIIVITVVLFRSF